MTFAPHEIKTETPIAIEGQLKPEYEKILTPAALDFLVALEVRFGQRRKALMERRQLRQAELDSGIKLDFLKSTRDVRESDWTIAGTPRELENRTVEITGPVDRKMMINAFNSGANVFMADFEDASSPTWTQMMDGQVNMYDYARGMLSHTDEARGKQYIMNQETAILKVRPRGLHMEEKHIRLFGKPLSAAFVDFGLHLFHNAHALINNADPSIAGPYFYLPKMESHLEARLWNDVIRYCEQALHIPANTIKATVLIETLPAAFEMDEILYELKNHIVGLNCGRWDYIFSYIKRIGTTNAAYLLPDRASVTMGDGFLKAYSMLLIQTCHKRGAHAMGGMAAQIPVKDDTAKNEAAYAKVQADKEREVALGHDGTWVAHPAMVDLARTAYKGVMATPNQLHRLRDDVTITAEDLITPPSGGACTEDGLRDNMRVGIQYLGAWLNGSGAVPINGLMEDAATAEISRTQIWQQLKFAATLDDGRPVTPDLVRRIYNEELEVLRRDPVARAQAGDRLVDAGRLFLDMVLATECAEFLTTPGYKIINQ